MPRSVGDPNFPKRLGALLRENRLIKGMSQAQLAKKVGCSKDLVSSVEQGKTCPSVPFLFSMADHLQISLDSLRKPLEHPVQRDLQNAQTWRYRAERAEKKLELIQEVLKPAYLKVMS
jgi:transcriptional regulator with XRE-family HTH domain